MSGRSAPSLVVTVVLALVLLACGQHPGVHVERGPLAAAPVAGQDDVPVDLGEGTGEVLEPLPGGPGDTTDGPTGGSAGEEPSDAPSPGGSTSTPGTSTGSGGSGGPSPAAGGGGDDGRVERTGERTPTGSDRTGVTAESITLAVHAPITGAAPLPAASFERASDLYWRWLTEEKGETVLGRSKVNVVFADDKYEPSAARQVCRQLAARAFTLVGGGGTDQIQACGQFAGQARVPYFSAGVTEAGLAGNPWYFATSMSYKSQGRLLAQYVRKQFPGKKAAAILTQTRNFDDAVQGWESSLGDIDYAGTLRAPKGDTSWYGTYARDLGQAGVEVIYPLVSVLDYIRFAQVASDQGYDFQFVGVGITMGLNDALRSGCPAIGKGTFFSPFPAFETIERMDPDFLRAARRFGVDADDIGWAIWGISKLQHQLFLKYGEVYGNDLTREDFRNVVAQAGRVRTGVFPDVHFTPEDNFGSTGVHVLRANCETRKYEDGGTFKSSF